MPIFSDIMLPSEKIHSLKKSKKYCIIMFPNWFAFSTNCAVSCGIVLTLDLILWKGYTAPSPNFNAYRWWFLLPASRLTWSPSCCNPKLLHAYDWYSLEKFSLLQPVMKVKADLSQFLATIIFVGFKDRWWNSKRVSTRLLDTCFVGNCCS